jgi:hypothetical protein
VQFGFLLVPRYLFPEVFQCCLEADFHLRAAEYLEADSHPEGEYFHPEYFHHQADSRCQQERQAEQYAQPVQHYERYQRVFRPPSAYEQH